MALRFRNIDADPSDPVERWGFEGLLAAVDRGDLNDWRRVVVAVRRDPWGDVARHLVDVFKVAEDVGVVAALRRAMVEVRQETERAEKSLVAEQVRASITASGLSQRDFAQRIGTSASRLSTYVNGSVTPSATLMVRMRSVLVGGSA